MPRRKRVQRNGLLDIFSTSTSYSVKKPLATKSSTGKMIYKGHKIWKTGDGDFEVPSIEKGTRFDSVGDAKKFIGYWEKQKQRNPMAKKKGIGEWIKVNAVRKLPGGSIQLLLPKGTMSNPGKRKSFLKKIGKIFGEVVGVGKGVLGNPSYTGSNSKYYFYKDEKGKIIKIDRVTGKRVK